MLQLRIPKRLMALIQTWGCVLLAILCLAFSFTPLFTLKTIDNAAEIEKSINDILDGTELEVEIPEKIDISAVKLIRSISLIVDVVKISKEIADAEKDEMTGNDLGLGFKDNVEDIETETTAPKEEVDIEAKKEELKTLLESEDTKNTLLTAFAIVTTVGSVMDNDADNGKSGIGTILAMILAIIAILYVLGFTLFFPIGFAISTLVTLIKVAMKAKNPLESAPVAAKQLNGLIVLPLLSMIFQCLIPGIDFGSGTAAILVIACISTFINIVISRTRNYPEDKNIFSLIVQGGALIGAIGFLVYFFNVIKTNIISTFLHGDWALYTVESAAYKAMGVKVSSAFLIDALLILLYGCLVISSIGYFVGCVQRLTLAGTRGKYSVDAPTHLIPHSVVLIVGAILPLVVSKMENLHQNFTDKSNGAYSSLVFTDDSKSALTTAMVGLGIMLVAEIAIVVCAGKFCKNLTDREKQEVLMGKTTDDEPAEKAEEKTEAKAEAKVEAPAEVKVEAPAEEAVEAPAEEAAEAPAEEAAEAPAEETVETPAE